MSFEKPKSPRDLVFAVLICIGSFGVLAGGLGLVSYAVSYGISAGVSSGAGETCEVKDVL